MELLPVPEAPQRATHCAAVEEGSHPLERCEPHCLLPAPVADEEVGAVGAEGVHRRRRRVLQPP